MQGMAFNWRRVLVKDYASACTWMIMALLLIGYERAVYGPGRAERVEWALLGMAIMTLVALAVFVSVLKKRRILRE
jgi:hypothetical protein